MALDDPSERIIRPLKGSWPTVENLFSRELHNCVNVLSTTELLSLKWLKWKIRWFSPHTLKRMFMLTMRRHGLSNHSQHQCISLPVRQIFQFDNVPWIIFCFLPMLLKSDNSYISALSENRFSSPGIHCYNPNLSTLAINQVIGSKIATLRSFQSHLVVHVKMSTPPTQVHVSLHLCNPSLIIQNLALSVGVVGFWITSNLVV